MSENTCVFCKHFDQRPSEKKNDESYGVCRRNSPSPAIHDYKSPGFSGLAALDWPLVEPDEYCGDLELA